jgi:hypothetical protein
MYIVRDKTTKEIIHVNPAPLSQALGGQEVYFKFDPETMEIGKTESRELPEHFEITAAGEIIELTLKEKAEQGLMTLLPTQKIVSEGAEEKIVDKTLSEQVAEGLRQLKPNQKVVGEEIVEKTIPEMLGDGSMTLDEVKQRKIQYFSDLAFEKRRLILPDYKLQNALFGIYGKQPATNYRDTVLAFRDEFYRLKALVEQAKSFDEIEAVAENFPKEIVSSEVKQ